jgi:alpha-D-ribose 1-methylphosphonate 5-triphosphate synthase subunit PhnH
MSRPGALENILEESEKVDINIDFLRPTLVIMLMLLDAEVSFKVISGKEKEVTSFISQLTYAEAKPLEEADFIFVLSDAGESGVETAFRDSKIGNLINPHKSATIVIEAPELSNNSEFMLRGPGIEEASFAGFGLGEKWIAEREKKNIEYPLGIDAIFVDRQANVLCVPRTTEMN